MSGSGDKTEVDLETVLPAGIKEQELLDAIVRSGYPLQTVVAHELSERGFALKEEWAFEDEDSGQRRAIDVVGELGAAPNPHQTDGGSSLVHATLLMECKQSRHPYVFFPAVSPPTLDEFPVVSGLGAGEVELALDDPGFDGPEHMRWHKIAYSRKVAVTRFVGLADHEYVTAPPLVASISKAVANGKKVELSGDEPYNSLVLPLTKAATAFRATLTNYRNSGQFHDVRAVIPVAVIDAPMIIAGKPGDPAAAAPTDWLRVVVRRAPGERPWWDHLDYEVVDIVHRSYLDNYLDEYLCPYLHEFWDRHTEHHDITLGGRAYVEGLEPEGVLPEDLRSRSRPTR